MTKSQISCFAFFLSSCRQASASASRRRNHLVVENGLSGVVAPHGCPRVGSRGFALCSKDCEPFSFSRSIFASMENSFTYLAADRSSVSLARRQKPPTPTSRGTGATNCWAAHPRWLRCRGARRLGFSPRNPEGHVVRTASFRSVFRGSLSRQISAEPGPA